MHIKSMEVALVGVAKVRNFPAPRVDVNLTDLESLAAYK